MMLSDRSARRLIMALVAGALLTTPLFAHASTWRVERDGSGDFPTIQPAVDASAPGDTILIGPGEYTETHEIQIPAWSFPTDACVYMTVENLTFIGVGAEQVIIGPEEYYPTYFGPLGFCGAGLTEHWHVEGITIQNVRDAMYIEGSLAVNGCRFLNNENGALVTWATGGTVVRECYFEDNNKGIASFFPSSGVEIYDSEFFRSMISVQNTSGIIIHGCYLEGDFTGPGAVGIQFDSNSSGIIRDCEIREMSNYGIIAIYGSQVTIKNCDIDADGYGLYVYSQASATCDSNIIHGDFRSIQINSGSIVTAHGNHILAGQEGWVGCDLYPSPTVTLDFEGNYWGTADPSAIAEGIWDATDDGSLSVTIDFEPFSSEPLPAEPTGWGDLKALYR